MFGPIICQFSDNLNSLRDFVELIAPFLAQKDIEKVRQDAFYLAPLLLAVKEFQPERLPMDEGEVDKVIDELIGDDVEVVVEEREAGQKTVHLAGLSKEYSEGFDRAMRDFRQRRYHDELLYRSSLINLICSVEWFLSQILHRYFDEFPEAVEERGKLFSLEDLKSIGSIEDARNYVIDSCVEDILRGSFDDWLEFLKNRLKLGMGYIDEHRDRLREACQRRNLLVHNGAIVNGIYIANTPNELREGVSIGDLIHVNRQYLEDVTSRFERCFVLIAAELWKKIAPADEERATVLIDIAYDHLLAERWSIAEGLSRFIMKDKQLSEKDQLVGRVNYWQSLKWQGRFEEIQEEVEAADFSAKDEVFRLAQLALLDDEKRFFELLPHLLSSEKLPLLALAEWPLFREMRKTPRFEEEYQPRMEDLDEGLSASVRAISAGTQPLAAGDSAFGAE